MTAITVKDIRLDYRVRQKATLSRAGGRRPSTGGVVSGTGRNRIVTALDGVSFSLTSGDRLGLVGSNGAGKTTLLKVLYNIYEPTRGTIDIDGRIDALFNINLGFRKEATGRRNIYLRGLLNGWSADEIENRMEDIISFAELDEFIDLPMKSYSSGMAARLAFSIATTLDPEILLMDEWIGAGDRAFQEKAQSRMSEIAARAGIIVLASHNQNLIDRTCNKIARLEKGRLVEFSALTARADPEPSAGSRDTDGAPGTGDDFD